MSFSFGKRPEIKYAKQVFMFQLRQRLKFISDCLNANLIAFAGNVL